MAADRHLTLASRAIRRESLRSLQDVVAVQHLLDSSVEGFTMERLAHLVGPGVAEHASEFEGLYQQMLFKLEGLARMVEKGSSRVLEQILRLGRRESIGGLPSRGDQRRSWLPSGY